MCGIAGLIAKRPVNPAAVQAMIDRMVHRGPDGEGLWASDDGRAALGHRRLAVIDPTPAGLQPMADASGRCVLTYNGEIYNYLEVGARLKSEGVAFRSQCDTEVLLAGYERWGETCLEEMNGMFAFALYDAEARKLFCARDRFGEKPFYYVETVDYFAFASEYKALFALAGVEADVDQQKLLRFLHNPRQGLDDERETVFRGIKQLLPGEKLTVDFDSLEVTVSRYWSLSPDTQAAGLDDAERTARFKDLLADSVKLRMRADVPQGSCLSGGLDSSAIVCLARKHLGAEAEYQTFTGRFPDTEADEWTFAAQVIEATGATSHVTEPGAAGFMDDLAQFIWFNELPTGSSSQYAQWCVFRLAAEHGVTVLLDGQGADELLAGYEQYFAAYLRSAQVSDNERQAITARYPLALEDPAQAWTSRLPTAVRWHLAQWTSRGSDFLFGLTPDLAASVADANRRDAPAPAGLHPLAAALYDDSFHAHLPTLLRYGDRNSMAHSREVRLPFCDHRLATFALSQAPGALMGNAQTKRLLRDAMDGVLPEPIRTRWNKQGFLPPQDAWFTNGLLAAAEEVISTPAFAGRGMWNVEWWHSTLKRLKGGEGHLAWTLWKPLMAEFWTAHFVDRVAAGPRLSVFAD